MFNQLTLTNFKAWKGSTEIPLAPVTMLLGTNSSGKSSILQSLLLLKQTIASPDRTIHLNLGGDEANDFFNFGNFDDVLSKGAAGRNFGVSLSIQRPKALIKHGSQWVHALRECEIDLTYCMTSAGAPNVGVLEMRVTDKKFRLIRKEKGAYSLYVDDETEARGKGRLLAPERSVSFSIDALTTLGKDAKLAQDISLLIGREFQSIAYLGPLRRKPERDYVWNKSRPGDLGADGAGVMNALLASELLKQQDDLSEDLLKEVSYWLKAMNVADRLELRQLGRSSRYELVIHKDGVAANLRDVGIGVSQVLPVLTLAYFAPIGSTVLLEEPEIHLHPLAQSILAELFVTVAKRRNIQFIVETHSEHLFRRMQTLIARDSKTLQQCRMYFVTRHKASSRLIALDVDEFGTVKNWPENFFGNSVGEARQQALARAAKMKARGNG